MNREEYFSKITTQKGRAEIVGQLSELVKDGGWEILCIYLEDASITLQAKINDINNKCTEQELQKDRIRLYYIKKLLEMPQMLASQIEQTSDDGVIGSVYE